MSVYGTYTHKRDDDGLEGPHTIHADGVPQIGSATLCGHTDRHDLAFKSTRKPVSCVGCLAIIDQVKRLHCGSAS